MKLLILGLLVVALLAAGSRRRDWSGGPGCYWQWRSEARQEARERAREFRDRMRAERDAARAERDRVRAEIREEMRNWRRDWRDTY
jgi:hypothetical protein